MKDKRSLGQYYTENNPFSHPLFTEWMATACFDADTILEPFAGANNILKLMNDSGYANNWKCYDIDPPKTNAYPKFVVEQRDTMKNFPRGFKVCVTNPPYLGKSSARRRKIYYPWKEDDMYKTCLNLMLNECENVAAIIPESFITANIHTDRLWGVVSLTCKMFDDTDCPVCLAMFTKNGRKDIPIYSNEEFLGTLDELSKFDVTSNTVYNDWVFNDRNGNIGVKTVDTQNSADCGFFSGELIKPERIKVSSRAFTRVSGLPENIDREVFIKKCNEILLNYRTKTKDVLMTSFKGLRKDGKYRRRLDFRTVRNIMNSALSEIMEKESRER